MHVPMTHTTDSHDRMDRWTDKRTDRWTDSLIRFHLVSLRDNVTVCVGVNLLVLCFTELEGISIQK